MPWLGRATAWLNSGPCGDDRREGTSSSSYVPCTGQLAYFHEVDRGGHFAAWEERQLCSTEVRAAFRLLR